MPSPVDPRFLFLTTAVCFKGQIFVLGGFDEEQGDELTLKVYDVKNDEWKPCQNVSLGLASYRLSVGRILKEVLDFCEEVSDP